MDETLKLCDGELSKADKEFLEKFTNCSCLSLCGVGLKQLRNMPKLPMLEMLSISDNLLLGDDFQYLREYKNLRYLDLSNNNVRLLDKLMDLAKLENLRQINLSANPCQEGNFYRENLFMFLPKVKVLDGFDKSG